MDRYIFRCVYNKLSENAKIRLSEFYIKSGATLLKLTPTQLSQSTVMFHNIFEKDYYETLKTNYFTLLHEIDDIKLYGRPETKGTT